MKIKKKLNLSDEERARRRERMLGLFAKARAAKALKKAERDAETREAVETGYIPPPGALRVPGIEPPVYIAPMPVRHEDCVSVDVGQAEATKPFDVRRYLNLKKLYATRKRAGAGG